MLGLTTRGLALLAFNVIGSLAPAVVRADPPRAARQPDSMPPAVLQASPAPAAAAPSTASPAPSAGAQPAADAAPPAAAPSVESSPAVVEPAAGTNAPTDPSDGETAGDIESSAIEDPAPPPLVPSGPTPSQRELIARKHRIEQERANASNRLPWLVVGTGAAGVLVGTVVGVAHTFSCDDGCESPPWVGLATVIGASVGTLGAIWLVRTDADIHQIELQKRQVELDMLQLERAHARRSGYAQRSAPAFNFRLAL